jgi:pSer/pThr/pTyr-binding forkhead associated (FHA) protein
VDEGIGRPLLDQQRGRPEAPHGLAGQPPERRPPRSADVPLAATTLSIPSLPKTPALRILVTSGADAGRVFDLHPGELTIGREEGSEILLSDLRISHSHAVLRVDGKHVTIKDLRSTNGTKVNGVAIERQTSLASGDQLALGGVILVVEER